MSSARPSATSATVAIALASSEFGSTCERDEYRDCTLSIGVHAAGVPAPPAPARDILFTKSWKFGASTRSNMEINFESGQCRSQRRACTVDTADWHWTCVHRLVILCAAAQEQADWHSLVRLHVEIQIVVGLHGPSLAIGPRPVAAVATTARRYRAIEAVALRGSPVPVELASPCSGDEGHFL